MPTYEYECKSCGHTFEAFQAMSDDPLKSCPQCGKDVRRLIFGGTGVIFKGSGFYVTDKSKAPGGAPKSAKGGDAASTGGSGENPAAPAAKSESSGGGENSGGNSAGGESTVGESAAKKTGSGEKAKPAAKTA
jgi:putative FmdB family regulatory protein